MQKYCSRCKQQIDSGEKGRWPLRSMCLRCGRARLITILALAGVAVAGFLAGHYSARPVTFNFIGSRIDPQLQPAAPASQAEEHQVPAGGRGAAVTASNGSVPSGTAAARPLYVG